MKPFFVWLTQSSARILVVILLALLGYNFAVSYQRGQDLRRLCQLLGPHDPTTQDVGADRRTIDAICLRQEADDDS